MKKQPKAAPGMTAREIKELKAGRPKPFKFQPNKRSQTDGGRRSRSNGDNADEAAEYLSLVSDRDALDNDEALTDLLTNILHWCDREHVSFQRAFNNARMHHEAEK